MIRSTSPEKPTKRIKRVGGCLYYWEIIKGPPYLVGRVVRWIDLISGGWYNGEIHARHLVTGNIKVKHDYIGSET
jgi:hypothetical protein